MRPIIMLVWVACLAGALVTLMNGLWPASIALSVGAFAFYTLWEHMS